MNLVRQEYKITKEDRLSLYNKKSFVLWFTGLSGSGKSTLSNKLEEELFKKNKMTYSLDGDNIRMGLNKNLSFSEDDRTENIRRISEVSKLFIDAGVIVLTSFISPFEKDRLLSKEIIGEDNFIEIYISTSLFECEKRDTKGLYKKARNGEIKDFTGIDSIYEEPKNPDLIIDTEFLSIEESVLLILKYLEEKNYVN